MMASLCLALNVAAGECSGTTQVNNEIEKEVRIRAGVFGEIDFSYGLDGHIVGTMWMVII